MSQNDEIRRAIKVLALPIGLMVVAFIICAIPVFLPDSDSQSCWFMVGFSVLMLAWLAAGILRILERSRRNN